MPDTTFEADRLHREADRCERLSHGLSDTALARRMREWAEDYRREALSLLQRAA